MQVQLANGTFKTTTLIRITAIAWFFGKIMSWKLWLSDRLFPLVAPIDIFPEFSNDVHFFLLLFSLTGLLLVVVFPKKTVLILAVLLLEITSCALDQLRWQPWEYQYLLTFFFCFLYRKDVRGFIDAMSLLLIATYIFSGLHKFNPAFLSNVWDNLFLHKLFGFTDIHPVLHYSGILLPVAEILSGIGLLFSKNKKPFVVLTLLMHAFLLMVLGPAGLHLNSVIWPWNAAMMLLVYSLFFNKEQPVFSSHYFLQMQQLPVILFAVILPATHFLGFWPGYLSFKLYSGHPKNLAICIKTLEQTPQLTPFVSVQNSPYCQGLQTINAAKWVFTELNVPIYAEESYYKKLKKSWIQKFPQTQSHFMIFEYPSKPENIKEIP